MPRRSVGASRMVTAMAGALMPVALLVGCSASPSSEAPRESGSAGESESGAPTTTGAPESPPVLVDGGSAVENKPYFDAVSGSLFARTPDAGRGAIIDALTEAGFAPEDLEATDDSTPIGNAVDSLQFAVRIGESCLLGDRGAGGFVSAVAPVLGTGRCLVGATPDIGG
ncbi:DUF6993 domain-containing protein [Planctomonas psychrotolerans]|uniref:DUF6993 domain-containing protein n=1 Tax=Planctomonas psychrotolerans TaxID=2528712 RepID=UPI00123BDC51|nr:hypothetical protein [Planctomonas psychrotolerans]